MSIIPVKQSKLMARNEFRSEANGITVKVKTGTKTTEGSLKQDIVSSVTT